MQNRQLDVSLSAVAAQALEKIRARGVDAAELLLSRSSGFTVTARNADIETLEHQQGTSLSVSVIHRQCTGHATSSDFSAEALSATIEKAVSFAHFAQADSYAGLPDPALLATHYPDCALHHPWSISTKEATVLAIACEEKALAFDKRIKQAEGASVSTLSSEIFYANTLGFLGGYASSEHSMGVSTVAQDGNTMVRESDYTLVRDPNYLWSAEQVAHSAAKKTIARLQARQIKTQTCPIIFEAPVARSLLGAFVRAISGGNLYRQSSFLLNALDTKIFPEFVTLTQYPHLAAAMGSRPFDAEGVCTVLQQYVADGKLLRYALGSYSARKLGMQSTGNAGGVFNLSLSSTDPGLPDLLRKMNRGLLVTELLGQGVNITTGDYSRGCAGFWVERGEIQFPVHEITIASNLKNMFAGITAIGNDIDLRSSIRTGSILIDQMTVAGET